MKKFPLHAWARATLLAAGFAYAWTAAQAAEIQVLSAGATAPVLQDVAAEFAKASGHTLRISFGTAGAVVKRFTGGEAADVVITATPLMGDLVKGGGIDAASATPLTRVGIGVAVPSGDPKPAIATVDAFKQTLIAAKSIVYTDPATGGASGIYVAKMLNDIGMAEQLKPKIMLAKGAAVAKDTQAQGSGTIGLVQISEIVGQQGVDYAGPLPGNLQNYTAFSIGISAQAKEKEAAQALLKFLKGPVFAAALKAKGMEPQ